jgi:hypothetical protein
MVEAALEFLNCCSITQWDFTEQKPIDQTMDKWKSAITIWKAGKAQLESKRAAVNHVCWCSGLQNWDWRKRRCVQVTNFEWNWLDLIGCRTDVCCDGWTALHRRGFSAKLRENVANFPAMEPVLLGAGFEIPREPSSKQNSNRNSWGRESVLNSIFGRIRLCEKEENDEALSRRREGICHCDKLEQSKFFHASCDPKE